MTRLPTFSARQVIQALLKAGFVVRVQHGSHVQLLHPVNKRRTTVPNHSGDLHRGLLKAILRQAGLSEDQFRELL